MPSCVSWKAKPHMCATSELSPDLAAPAEPRRLRGVHSQDHQQICTQLPIKNPSTALEIHPCRVAIKL